MDNHKIAEVLQEIGDILEIQDANRFRILAYQRASLTISELGEDLGDIYQRNPKDLEKIPGVGKDLAAKIVELLTKGKCKYHQDLLKHFPKDLLEMLRIRGLGPKKVKLFYSHLQIDTLEKLKQAAEAGELRKLPRMGEKSEAEILKAISEHAKYSERMMLSEALYEAQRLREYMKKCKGVDQVEYAGSVRRMKETVGDLDILVSAKKSSSIHEKIMDYFVKYEDTDNVIVRGSTKSSIILKSGVQVDLRVVEGKSFGAALHYFTGSKEHNIALRDRAKKMGLRVNEYGVFELVKNRGQEEPEQKFIAGKTEKEVYKAVGLPYIEPLLRENRGEIEAAAKGKLPKTVELKDLCGDLHVHSEWSDGSDEIEVIARAYRDAGYDYIALTDHSSAVVVAHGLTVDRFRMQWDEIDEVNEDLAAEAKKGKRPFVILKGVECDILPDGSMDLPESILKEMDIVVASVHSRFRMSEKEMTARILKAFKNPHVKIFGHPTGRKINNREPYAVDMGKIIKAAAHHGVAIEINSQPLRLDLFDYYCKIAKEKGVKFTIDSDSHHISQIAYLEYGISVAKRGWLTKEDVLNTRSLKDLMKFWGERK